MHSFIRSLGAILLGAFFLTPVHAQIHVGDGAYTFNFVVQFWNVPDPEPTPATAETLAELGTAGSVYWFQVNYDLDDLSPVTGLPEDFISPIPSAQQVISLWSSLVSGASVDYGGPYAGFGYSLTGISIGSESNSGFGDYYWSLYTGGTGATANWVSSWEGVSSIEATEGLWFGFKYTPSSYSFADLDFVETAPDLIPEPGSTALLFSGAIGLWLWKRRRNDSRA